nr:hypothetical protein [Lentzea albidocapillata]
MLGHVRGELHLDISRTGRTAWHVQPFQLIVDQPGVSVFAADDGPGDAVGTDPSAVSLAT